ncbi:DeoR/GlpR family DNA-binding transcription regulator [Leifsonia sp. Root112D2]|uniref:DeoR/GlpR family DNA-binding transcription regulator n=1 Tax=Leifsonia sp. Root112D2 TaxID=1736426 RepID=UPI0006F5F776|nr:DeoR/GlpR family DNA-binding transcription regulator [Leifsonia sp. Root112D2]KQV07285.1 DeoR family transcriptional regulator [Leifsonia sp. Root112D2]
MPTRRDRLARLVAERGFLHVTEASDELGVSLVTVRSDLNALQASGVLRRVHGGAVSNGGMEASFERSLTSSAEEKQQIAELAAGLVESGSTVLLDVGSTTALVGRALAARQELHDVTVITNGLTIALELERAIPRFQVIVTGGTLRPLQHSLVDPLASVLLGHLTADIAFIGCNGVHAERGVTNVNLPEAELKRLMVASAQRAIVVADGSKIGGTHVGRIASLDEVESLITGASASDDELARLRAAGLAVSVARAIS